MLSTTFMLLVSGAFLMLRLGETAGSFPRPLPAREERRYVEAWLAGDVQARNILIEHNLRRTHREKILRRLRRRGGSDLHRYGRADKGRFELPSGKGRPPGNIRFKVH